MIENKTIENKSIVIFFLLTRVLCVLSAYTLKCLRCLPDASRACITTEWTCHSRNALCATRRISSFAGVVFYGALCFNCEKKKKRFCTGPVFLRLLFHVCAGDAKMSDVHLKTCVLQDECSEGSVNFGISRIVVTSHCCTSNLCNAGNAPGNSLTLSVGI